MQRFMHSYKFVFPTVSCVKLVIIFTIVNTFLLVGYIKYSLNAKYYDITPESITDVLCHYEEMKDGLPIIGTDFEIESEAKNIFFLETSCKRTLNYREMCAIESAAKTNSNYNVYVLFVSHVPNANLKEMFELQLYKNVLIGTIDLNKYIEGTPVENLIRRYELLQSIWPVSHTSDVLRFLTLYKYGGVYLDLDVIVTKSFDTLPNNFAGKEGVDQIGTAVLGITLDKVGAEISKAFLQKLAISFQGYRWTKNGPDVVTKVLEKICNTSVLYISESSCKGFTVFNESFFYPFFWDEGKRIFGAGESMRGAYTYHIWNKITKNIKIDKDSLYARLAKKYCPIVYGTYRNEFRS